MDSKNEDFPDTVFVIGAGASNELSLPTGVELKKDIAEVLNIQFDESDPRLINPDQISGDPIIYGAMQKITNKQAENLVKAGHDVRKGITQAISIDNFIDAHKGNELIEKCGKLAIIKTILRAEQNSPLFLKNSSSELDFSNIEQTWHNSFFQLLTENCTFNDIPKRFRKVGFIIFNYDRCIEHYIYHSMQNYYRISKEDAAESIKSIKFFHPYGIAGNLPWTGKSDAIDFGGEPSANQMAELIRKIKTFTEGTDPSSSEITEIQDLVQNADRLIFLGFAFHELNLKVLFGDWREQLRRLRENTQSIPKVFGTAHGISESDIKLIRNNLELKFRMNEQKDKLILRPDKTCNDLFSEYWRSLSFSKRVS